jgi:hypothetical protein
VSAWKLVLLAIYWDQTRLEAQYIVVRQVENRVHTQTLKPNLLLHLMYGLKHVPFTKEISTATCSVAPCQNN